MKIKRMYFVFTHSIYAMLRKYFYQKYVNKLIWYQKNKNKN